MLKLIRPSFKAFSVADLRFAGVLTFSGLAMACAAEPAGPSAVEEAFGSTEAAITVFDCQRDLNECNSQSRRFFQRARCAVEFQSCTAQSALDLVKQENLLAECRGDATSCLEGALTLSDIQVCRDVYQTCSSEILATAEGVLDDAAALAEEAIDQATEIATAVIERTAGELTEVLDSVSECRGAALSCVEGAVTVTTLESCQDVFDACVGDAVALAEQVAEALPGPTPGEVLAGLDDCRGASQACIEGALSLAEIDACQSVGEVCLNNAVGVVEDAVTETVTDTLDVVDTIVEELPVPVPTPSETIDCSAQFSQCLLTTIRPFACAEQARVCLGS